MHEMNYPLPNFVLLGVQKSGSTALYDWLSQHPDVFGNPAMKDFPFFCEDRYYDRGLDWFGRQFRGYHGESVVLHGYVHYLFFGRDVAERLISYRPSLKALILLRDPVERAFSGWLQARKTGNEDIDVFEEALQADREGRLTRVRDRANRSYLSHGLYSHQIEEYLQYFPAEQLKIELFDSIRDDPGRICRDVFSFMGVDTTFEPAFSRKNDHSSPRSKLIETIVRKGIPSDRLRNLLPLSIRTKIRLRIRAMNMRPEAKPEMAEDTRGFLRDYYAEEYARLEALTGLDLHHWKTNHGATDASEP